jgi:tRNA1(Val) A37 N6-methylase TrmN6
MYQPAEDSLLLEKHVEKLSKGNVLDLGTGVGIQALAASRNKSVSAVLAADIDKETVS